MTVYAPPGTEGSVVSYEARYDNWIGGKRVAPVKGQYFENVSPINGKPFCEIARSTAVALPLILHLPAMESYQLALGVAAVLSFPTLAGSISVGAAGIIPPWAAALTAIGAIAGAVIVGAKTFAAFRARYKSQVIAPIISFLDPSFTYDPEAHLGKNELLDCALFPEKASMLSGEDLITGKLDDAVPEVPDLLDSNHFASEQSP